MDILWLVVVTSCVLLNQHAFGLQFIAVGDWGDDSASGIQDQRRVAQAMSNWCGTHECLFILDTGDNFYEAGVTSVTDPRFDTSWRWIYNLTNIEDKLWFISLGNHDHGPDDGREQFQIDFGQTEPRWYYPSLWYDVHYTDGITSLHLIIVDSESLKQDKNDPAGQLAWLEATLAGSTTDDWKIVIDHHPPYSSGNYGPTDDVIVDQMLPICLQYGADLIFNGHDHNLQHISPMVDRTIDYIITGGGGRLLYRQQLVNEQALNALGLQVDHFGFNYGFVSFDFSPNAYTAEFVDDTSAVTYTYSRSR